MNEANQSSRLVDIATDRPVWDRFYSVAPLVLVGTVDPDGSLALAPKHMAAPMGWENYFGFVCTPSHGTFRNIERSGVFTVSFPKPSQVLFSSLAASPRLPAGDKPVIEYFATFPAKSIEGGLIEEAYLYFECRHFKTVSGFGRNCLITGEIIAAYGEPGFLRSSDVDDQELIHESPLLAYLAPGRFATIDRSNAFPFPADMHK